MRNDLVLSLGILVAACSTGSSDSGPGSVLTPSTEAGAPPSANAPGPDAAASEEDSGAKPPPTKGTCPASIGTFPEAEYLRPMHTLDKGSCSATDLETLDKIGLGSFAARRSMVSASCAKCVYSDYDDPSWGLLVVVDPDTALTNYAGCSIHAGDTRACIKMNSAWRFCTRKACSSCPANARNDCAESESTSGQCKTYFDADTACSGSFPAGCTSAMEMIATYCGP